MGRLSVRLGQHSSAGRKPQNQDFHGALVPDEPLLAEKGIVVALADGISSSTVSRTASEAAVKTIIEDYYCTSPAWSVKRSARQVLMAVNSWLHAQTRQSPFRYDKDRGYVCTFSAIVLKGATAHVFHVGDACIHRLRDGTLEQITEEHRLWVADDVSYLSRALGFNEHLELDYHAVPIAPGDAFVIATDGVHEFVGRAELLEALRSADDLDTAATRLANTALERGSGDNLTVQLVQVEGVATPDIADLSSRAAELPCPAPLASRALLDGYRIVRELHSSSRSHVYLASDGEGGIPVVLKILSTEMAQDAGHLERFLQEEWIARRVVSPHVVKALESPRRRTHLYTLTEYVEGRTLAQWMLDNPRPDVETVRDIVEQLARGLTAFHRLEMLHQDLRPANVMIDATGTVRIIDFGSVSVAGLEEQRPAGGAELPLGTLQYSAPEYFLGEPGTPRSDLYSLGVIAYQLLSGRLPYGADVGRARTPAAQRQLVYRSVLDEEREIPAWIDDVLRKATHPNPLRRYEELSEFVYDLRHPTESWRRRTKPPLIERHPAGFWRAIALLLAVALVVVLVRDWARTH